MEPIEDRASMACAALVRGTASFEKTVTPTSANFSTSSGSCGPFRKQIRTWPSLRSPISSSVGLAVHLVRAVGDARSRLLVRIVEVVVASGARLDDDLETILDEPAYGLGHEPDPALALGHLPRYPYFHAPDYSVGSGCPLPKPDRYQQSPVL